METVVIDILTDSVNDICDKLFYEASGGKFIDYAWDAPQPAAVNPLSMLEVEEWGEAAMTIEFPRAAANPKRLGKRKISSIRRFVQRSAAQPFYGYKSEAPKARAFDIEEPRGPMAKAVKAAGTLAALCDRTGESDKGVWQLLEGTWGEIPKEAKDAAKPDLAVASDTDLIKLVRSPVHMLFGFNSKAPATSVNLGKYRSETIMGNYMIDWHSLVISLRFIGETIARYSTFNITTSTKIRFSPVLSESRTLSFPKYAVSEKDYFTYGTDEDLLEIRGTTLRDLTVGLSAKVSRSEMVASRQIVKIDFGEDVTDQVIKKVLASFVSRRVNLPTDVTKKFTETTVYDISNSAPGAFKRSMLASLNKLDLSWIPTWAGVHTSVWVSAFSSPTVDTSHLVSIMRRISYYDTDDPAVNKKLSLTVAQLVPDNIGHLIMVMLKHMIPSTQDAMAEFIKMIMSISGDNDINPNMSAANAYKAAIANSSDIEPFIRRLNIAHSSYQSRSHGATKLLEYMRCDELSVAGLTRSFSKFMLERLSYWKTHYSSRVVDSRNSLATAKKVLMSKHKVKFKTESSLAIYNTEMFDKLSANELKSMVTTLKADVIKYSFAASCYGQARVGITDSLDPELYLTPMDLREILMKAADNYIRKRQTWGKNLVLPSDTKGMIEARLRLVNRHHDMLDSMDEILRPAVKWKDCYNFVIAKFDATRKSVKQLLRHIVANRDNAESEAIKVDIKENEDLDRNMINVVFGDNAYAALYDGSDESESEDEPVLTSVALEELDPFAYDIDFTPAPKEAPNLPKTDVDLFSSMFGDDDEDDIFGAGPAIPFKRAVMTVSSVLRAQDLPREFVGMIDKYLETHADREVKLTEADSITSDFSRFCSITLTKAADGEDEDLTDIV